LGRLCNYAMKESVLQFSKRPWPKLGPAEVLSLSADGDSRSGSRPSGMIASLSLVKLFSRSETLQLAADSASVCFLSYVYVQVK
jgi:hypothetical protein